MLMRIDYDRDSLSVVWLERKTLYLVAPL